MKTSDIVQVKRDMITAMDAAGKKEFGWFVMLEKLDELGYDLVQRSPSPQALIAAVEACVSIAETVSPPLTGLTGAVETETDRLFAAG